MQMNKLGYLAVGASLGYLLHALLKKRAPEVGHAEPAPVAGDNVIRLDAWRRLEPQR